MYHQRFFILLFVSIFTFSLISCGSEEPNQQAKDSVELWSEKDSKPVKENESTTSTEDSRDVVPTTNEGDSRVTMTKEEGNIFATIAADLPNGTMIATEVTGEGSYKFQTSAKMKDGNVKIGAISKDGKPLPKGSYTFTWAPVPTQAQQKEIQAELRRKNESGGKKRFTVPL